MAEPKPKAGLFKLADKVVASKALYAVLAVSFVLYLLTKSPLFALLVALSIAGEFIAETLSGVAKHGWFRELREIGIAVLIALVVWFGGGYVLQTHAPLNAVVSCSMLPSLDRGDMMVLQGALPNAPEIQLSEEAWGAFNFSGAGWCGLCKKQEDGSYELCQGTPVRPIEIVDSGGSLLAYGTEVREEAPAQGNVGVECGWCEVALGSGKTVKAPCATGLRLGSAVVHEDLSNDVVVYTAGKGDRMPGEIIHRVYARVNADGKYYFITKGDNNPQFDFQYGNAPVPEGRVTGKTILRIPYLGYVKLFLFGYLATPPGCDSRILH